MKLTLEELRGAYARGTSAGSGEHPAPEVLARLLDGAVSAEERARVVGHVAACSRCAEEVRVARSLGTALAKTDEPVARPAAWRRPAVLVSAAAAVLLVGGLAVRTATRPESSGGTFRSSREAGLRSLLPPGVPLPRPAPVLRWTGAPAGATFDVVLANERLDVLAKIPGLKAPQLTVPASVLAALPAGSKLVWKVTAVQPDGSRPYAATFVSVVE